MQCKGKQYNNGNNDNNCATYDDCNDSLADQHKEDKRYSKDKRRRQQQQQYWQHLEECETNYKSVCKSRYNWQLSAQNDEFQTASSQRAWNWAEAG